MTDRICSIPGCGKPHRTRGWCAAHYQRWHVYGDPLGGGTPRRRGWTLDAIVEDELAKAIRDSNGCWIAQCSIGSHGYPQVRHGGKVYKLIRLVLGRKLGRPLRADEVARHKCDMPMCINPGDLEPGTVADNNRDMAERGRHGSLKLTTIDVAEIRRLREEGLRLVDIGARFGVGRTTISDICTGKRHVEPTDPRTEG